MMRIREIEIKNHQFIGDLHIENLDNEINCFLGANGSGKSFTLGLLTPSPKSLRKGFSTYPIQANLFGLKRIVWDFYDGTQIEIICEYTPKSKRDKTEDEDALDISVANHACKCYINKYVNGVKEELNPTGHVIRYRDLVKQHLNFNFSLSKICNISNEEKGILSADFKSRKDILGSFLDTSELLEVIKQNVSNLNKDKGSMVKLLEGNKNTFLSKYISQEFIKETIEKKEDELEKSINDTKTAKEELEQFNNRLNKLKQEDPTDLAYLIIMLDTLKSDDVLDTVISELNRRNTELQVAKSTLSNLKFQKETYSMKLDSFKQKLSQLEKKKNLEEEMNKKIQFIKTILKLDGKSYDLVLNNFNSFIKEFTNVNSQLLYLNINTSLDEYKNSLKEKYNELDVFIKEFDKYDSQKVETNCEAELELLCKTDACETCPAYIRFFVATEFVEKNASKYITAKEDIADIEEKLLVISKADSFNNKLKEENIISNLFTEEFIKKYSISAVSERFHSIVDDIHMKINEEFGALQTLTESYNSIQVFLDDTENMDDINVELDKVMSEIEELKTTIQDNIKYVEKYMPIDKIPENIKFKYKDFSIQELKDKSELLENYVKTKEHIERFIKIHKQIISDNESKEEELRADIYDLNYKLKEFMALNETLEQAIEARHIYSRCKDIITKNIPIKILERYLVQIELLCNKIFADNDLDWTIEFMIKDTDIIIQPTLNDNCVMDISISSSGQQCLLAIVLNAVITHLNNYPIFVMDEIDANLDVINRRKFNNIVNSILTTLNINQIFCVSHNITSTVESASKYLFGNAEGLDLPSGVIKLVGSD